MNWTWLGPLAVGGAGAAIFVYLQALARRELSRTRLARVEVEDARSLARRAAQMRASEGGYHSRRAHQ